jgi:hypothetical protein
MGFAALYPSYKSHSKPSRPLLVVIDRQHLAADRLGGVGGEEHREGGDVFRVDHRLDRLLGHRHRAHFLDRSAADLGAAGEDALDAVALDRSGRVRSNAEAAFRLTTDWTFDARMRRTMRLTLRGWRDDGTATQPERFGAVHVTLLSVLAAFSFRSASSNALSTFFL